MEASVAAEEVAAADAVVAAEEVEAAVTVTCDSELVVCLQVNLSKMHNLGV